MSSKPLMAAAALGLAVPVQAAAQEAAVAESTQPNSAVSVLVEPQLSDGRLILKVAAKNSSSSPVQFGPSNVQISKPNGDPIGIYPLEALVNDVRAAAGMDFEEAPGGRPAESTYSAPQLGMRDGRVDPTGYTGGARIGQEEFLRQMPRRSGKPTISEKEAEQQITALNAAILRESTVAPGQVVAGQLVSQTLDFAKNSDRTLHVRVRIAGDEHSYTVAAPRQ